MNIEFLKSKHPKLEDLCDVIKSKGGRVYLAGGCVRDMLLGLNPGDLDIEVFGLREEELANALKTRFLTHKVGKSFGVFKLRGIEADISIPRLEEKTGPKHTDFEISLKPDLEIREAALRRDFTINSMYWDLAHHELIDPYGGKAALEQKILRHTSDKFSEDPLRVYRAMQFVARFDLNADAATIELCKSMSPDNISRERIFEEWNKMLLKGTHIRKALNFLREVAWISEFPELENLINCEQDPKWHPEGDVWNHTLLAMDAFAAHRKDESKDSLVAAYAILCHDMGKPHTSTVNDNGRIRSPGHDIAGVPIAVNFLNRLTQDTYLHKWVPILVKEHMQPMALYNNNAGDAAIRRLAHRAGRIDLLMQVCMADRRGRGEHGPTEFPEFDWLNERIERLNLMDQAPKPIIQGRDLIKLGLKPGSHFSEILDKVFQAQLDGEFQSYEQGLIYLKQLLANKNTVHS